VTLTELRLALGAFERMPDEPDEAAAEWTEVASGSRLDMPAMAELVCHVCGSVSWSKVPRFRPDTMPDCPCGGRRQIVRIQHSLRNRERPEVPRDPEATD